MVATSVVEGGSKSQRGIELIRRAEHVDRVASEKNRRVAKRNHPVKDETERLRGREDHGGRERQSTLDEAHERFI